MCLLMQYLTFLPWGTISRRTTSSISEESNWCFSLKRRILVQDKCVLHVREFSFHQVNANLLWPGAVLFADWIVEHHKLLEGRKVLELGSGTGALAIFLTKKYGLDVTTSDYDDVEIENNIKLNCQLNELSALPHIRHTWGEVFPEENPQWDLIIASDILLYVKQYANLIKTLSYLFRKYKPLETAEHSSVGLDLQELDATEVGRMEERLQLDSSSVGTQRANEFSYGAADEGLPRPCFLMSWRRRIPKEDEAKFFEGCKIAGFCVNDLGSRVYSIHPASL
ncbi:hypothetical protein Mapa_010020 [Marchantia paleacea]|nr:hypothetical protein Mapa_010020 [Marchantia paleacea]